MKFCDELTETELRLRLFNKAYAFCIFFWKLYLITATTTYTFFTIRGLRRDTDPVMFTSFLFYAFFHAILFIVMYDKAFDVPEKFFDLKEIIKFKARQLRVKSGSDYIQRRIRAIPNLGIRVGSFTYFERYYIYKA